MHSTEVKETYKESTNFLYFHQLIIDDGGVLLELFFLNFGKMLIGGHNYSSMGILMVLYSICFTDAHMTISVLDL